MNDIWKIGQENKAENYYNSIKDLYKNQALFTETDKEELAVKALSSVCQGMINDYNNVVLDEKEYLIEAENIESSIEETNNEIQKKLEEIKIEIKELEEKKKDGTITEDEQNKLQDLYIEQDQLASEIESNLHSGKNDLNNISQNATAKRSKEAIAKDYGEITVQKGTELAKVGDEVGTLGKILSFGLLSDHSAQKTGEAAVETGNELLGIVGAAKDINDEINKKSDK